jgi:hypothetical protein
VRVVTTSQCAHGIEVPNKVFGHQDSSKRHVCQLFEVPYAYFFFVIHFSFESFRVVIQKVESIFKIASKLRRQKGEVVQVQISEKIEVVQCSLNHVMLFPYLISQLV